MISCLPGCLGFSLTLCTFDRYVSDDVHERVKHYLVKPEDFRDISLADFIRSKPQVRVNLASFFLESCVLKLLLLLKWVHLLRLDVNSGNLMRAHKDDLLRNFYSGGQVQPKKSGGYTLL